MVVVRASSFFRVNSHLYVLYLFLYTRVNTCNKLYTKLFTIRVKQTSLNIRNAKNRSCATCTRLINPDLSDRFTVHLHRSLKIIQNMFERARSDVRVYVGSNNRLKKILRSCPLFSNFDRSTKISRKSVKCKLPFETCYKFIID